MTDRINSPPGSPNRFPRDPVPHRTPHDASQLPHSLSFPPQHQLSLHPLFSPLGNRSNWGRYGNKTSIDVIPNRNHPTESGVSFSSCQLFGVSKSRKKLKEREKKELKRGRVKVRESNIEIWIDR